MFWLKNQLSKLNAYAFDEHCKQHDGDEHEHDKHDDDDHLQDDDNFMLHDVTVSHNKSDEPNKHDVGIII